jgi:hypothetical protein
MMCALIGQLQAGEPLFPNPVHPVGQSPRGVGVADFNRDGWDDVIVASFWSEDATLLLGRGDGSFEPGHTIWVLSRPSALTVGDFDGDRNPDFVVAAGGLLVYFGKGDGTFVRRTFPGFSNATDIAAGNFNDDGFDDIAVSMQFGPTQLVTLTGRKDRLWGQGGLYRVGGRAEGLDLGDLDENGTQDIAVMSQCETGDPHCTDGGIFIFSGGGDGSFVQDTVVPVPIPNPDDDVLVDDLDHDGHLDLVTPYGGELLIHPGNGDGTFDATTSLTAGTTIEMIASSDLDGDGLTDLLVADRCLEGGVDCESASLAVLMGEGGGAFATPVSYPAELRYGGIELGDFNTDGIPDVALALQSPHGIVTGLAEILLGLGDGTFPSLSEIEVAEFGPDIYPGDLDGDGLDEILTIGPPLRVIRRGADGALDQSTEYPMGGEPSRLTFGDVNHDGRVDVATANRSTDDMSVFLGIDGGGLNPETRYPTPIKPSAIAAGDFNNDGWDDLAVATQGRFNSSSELDDIVLFVAKGDGGFEAPVAVAAIHDPNAMVAGDFDADGNRDLAVGGRNGPCGIFVLRGQGDGSFLKEGPYATNCYVQDIAIGDVNADGREDLAVANGLKYPGTPNVDVLIGNGHGAFVSGPALTGGGATIDLDVADVNHDGYDDVVLLDFGFYIPNGLVNSPTISIWTATGGGAFAPRTTYNGTPEPYSMAVGRLTSDGRLSLLLTERSVFSNPDHLWMFGNLGPGRDADGDGFDNADDPCTDTDDDGYGDPDFAANTCPIDNCPGAANPDQDDIDGDGVGDACDRCTDTDRDGAGYPDFGLNRCFPDNCIDLPNSDQSDIDDDGRGDACDACSDPDGDGYGTPGLPANTCPDDNCPDVANSSQNDADSDGAGDKCDQCPFDPLNDWDYDGACGDVDNCPMVRNADQSDQDDDGLGDLCDNCPNAVNPDQEDSNGDGDGDACQPSLQLLEIREDGGDYLEVTVAANDPQDDSLSGTVEIRSTVPQGFALPDISVVRDCNAAILTDGIAGKGIAFVYARYRQPFLFDLGRIDRVLGLGCGDAIDDYKFGVGRCDDPNTVPGISALRVGNLALPAAICAIENAPGVGRIDLTLSSVSPDLIGGEVVTLDERTIPFTDGLPGMIDLTGLKTSGQHALTITVTDGNTLPLTVESPFLYQDELALIFNSPPRASFALDPLIECDSPQGAVVTLDGTSSSDADSTPGTKDDIESFEWFEDLGLPGERPLGSGPILMATLSFGQHSIALRVTDQIGVFDTSELQVTVRDSTPPGIGLFASPLVLWPPNHRMVPIDVSWQVTDLCDENPSVALIAVSSNESDEAPGPGDGQTYGDIAGADIGTADTGLMLRAERSGSGPGRIYELLYRASDATGNMMPAFGIITVPHDAGLGSEPLILRLDQDSPGGDSLISWTAVPEATGYDVIAADVGEVKALDGILDLGEVEVLTRATWMTSLAAYGASTALPLGRARMIVIQSRHGGSGQGFGTESASLPRVPSSCAGGCP